MGDRNAVMRFSCLTRIPSMKFVISTERTSSKLNINCIIISLSAGMLETRRETKFAMMEMRAEA